MTYSWSYASLNKIHIHPIQSKSSGMIFNLIPRIILLYHPFGMKCTSIQNVLCRKCSITWVYGSRYAWLDYNIGDCHTKSLVKFMKSSQVLKIESNIYLLLTTMNYLSPNTFQAINHDLQYKFLWQKWNFICLHLIRSPSSILYFSEKMELQKLQSLGRNSK